MNSLESPVSVQRRHSPNLLHLLRHHVLPFFDDGVPLAMAAAGPSLRLSAETYRAGDNYTMDLRQDILLPRQLGEADSHAVYTAKRLRACGVRVGAVITILHADDDSDAQEIAADSWLCSNRSLPVIPRYTAADIIALHDAEVRSGCSPVAASAAELSQIAAVQPPPCTAGEHDDFTFGMPYSVQYMTTTVSIPPSRPGDRLLRAKYDRKLAGFCRIMDAKQHILHSKTEEDDTTATPHHQRQQQQRRSPVRRHLYLQDDGSAEQLLSLSRWWLERPIHSSSTFCPTEGSPMPDVQSPPLYLHLFSPSMAHVRAAVKAVCGPQQRLEGLYVTGYPAETLLYKTKMEPFLLPSAALSHLRVLSLPDGASDDMLRAVLTPAPGDDGRSPSVRCRLEVVQLAGGRRVQSLEPLLALAPIAAPDSGTAAVLFRGLTSVDVSFTAIDNAALDGLLARSPHLHRLSVAGCVRVSALGRPGRHLWHLDASHTGVDGAGIAGLAGHPALAHLSLSNCARLTDVTALSELPALLALDITGVAATRGVDRLHACRALEQLSVAGEGRPSWRGGSGGSDAGLFPSTTPTAVSSFAALTRLVLSSVPWLDDAAVERLARTDAPLAVLTLSGAPEQLTTLNPLAGDLDHPGFRHTLKTLILRHNGGLTVEGMERLAELTVLEEVSIIGCPLLADLSAFAQVPSLRTLTVESNDDGGVGNPLAGYALSTHAGPQADGAVKGVAERLAIPVRQLEVLSLQDHPNVGELTFLAGMPRLMVADMSYSSVSTQSLREGVAAHVAAIASYRSSGATPGAVPVAPAAALLSSLLHTIRLDHCEDVTDVSCLAHLPSLRSVSLVKTSVTDEGIAELLFRPGPGVEVLDLTGCTHLTFDFAGIDAGPPPPATAASREEIAEENGEGSKDGVAKREGELLFSSLRMLSLVGCLGISEAALEQLFRPRVRSANAAAAVPAVANGKTQDEGGSKALLLQSGMVTFFQHLSEVDVSLLPSVTSVVPFLPLSASLRVLVLRFTRISTTGLSRLHELQHLRSLDLQSTRHLVGLAGVLSHPQLRQLDMRDLQLMEPEPEAATKETAAGGMLGGLMEGELADAADNPLLLLPNVVIGCEIHAGLYPPLEQLSRSPLEDLAITPSAGHVDLLTKIMQLSASEEGSNEHGGGTAVSPSSIPLPALKRLFLSGPVGSRDVAEKVAWLRKARPLLHIKRA